MAVYDTDDEIPVDEGEPERKPAAAPAFDMQAFAQAMATHTAQAIETALGKFAETMRPAEKPRATNPGSLLRDRTREMLGIEDDDLVERYSRASALDALRDEYGDDPKVQEAIRARTAEAPLIRMLAQERKERLALAAKFEAQEQAAKQRQARDSLLAKFEAGDVGELRTKAPRLFSGQMSDAHKKLLRVLVDGGTPDDLLPVVDELVATARPRNPRLSAAPGGTGRDKPEPFKVVSDAAYDEMVDKIAAGEEMN